MNSKSTTSAASWEGEHLEDVDACLFCGGGAHAAELPGAEDYFFRCVPGTFAFVRCQACGSLWLPSRLDPDHLPLAYSQYYTHAASDAGETRNGLRERLRDRYVSVRFGGSRRVSDRVLARLYRQLAPNPVEIDAFYRFAPPAPAKVLDYGCGGGEFLRRMKALGYEVSGIDFDPQAIRVVREGGIDAFTPDEAPAEDWQGHFDLVTLGHVIEHVADPVALLRQLRGWLQPEGRIFIEVPSAKAAGLAVFGKYWRGLEVPRHLALPSPQGLRLALSTAGLAVERSEVRPSVRRWLWQESLEAVPPAEVGEITRKIETAPPEGPDNAEFLVVLAKPEDCP